MMILEKEYEKFKLDDERIKLWNEILSDVEIGAIMTATKQIISDDRPFAPTAGQVRTLALDIQHGKIGQMTAEESWERICKYIQHEQVALTAHEKRALNATKTIFDLLSKQSSSPVSFSLCDLALI